MLTRIEMAIIAFAMVASFIGATAFPLLTYATTLALFGLAHIACELRFVDQRFSWRMNKSFTILLGVVLLAIVCMRASMVFGLAPLQVAYNSELALVVVLALVAYAYMPVANKPMRWLTMLFVIALSLGLLVSPVATVLVLAVMHNLTPLGFIVELAPSPGKKIAFIGTILAFVGIPLLIASGALSSLLEMFVTRQQDLSIFPTGPLANHLGAFLPPSIRSLSWSTDAFAGIVFAQCMHYLAVIFVMPRALKRLQPRQEQSSLVAWPKSRWFWATVIVSTACLVVVYVTDFVWARSLYSIAAVLHAYVEIPLLLWAFASVTTTEQGQVTGAAVSYS